MTTKSKIIKIISIIVLLAFCITQTGFAAPIYNNKVGRNLREMSMQQRADAAGLGDAIKASAAGNEGIIVSNAAIAGAAGNASAIGSKSWLRSLRFTAIIATLAAAVVLTGCPQVSEMQPSREAEPPSPGKMLEPGLSSLYAVTASEDGFTTTNIPIPVIDPRVGQTCSVDDAVAKIMAAQKGRDCVVKFGGSPLANNFDAALTLSTLTGPFDKVKVKANVTAVAGSPDSEDSNAVLVIINETRDEGSSVKGTVYIGVHPYNNQSVANPTTSTAVVSRATGAASTGVSLMPEIPKPDENMKVGELIDSVISWAFTKAPKVYFYAAPVGQVDTSHSGKVYDNQEAAIADIKGHEALRDILDEKAAGGRIWYAPDSAELNNGVVSVRFFVKSDASATGTIDFQFGSEIITAKVTDDSVSFVYKGTGAQEGKWVHVKIALKLDAEGHERGYAEVGRSYGENDTSALLADDIGQRDLTLISVYLYNSGNSLLMELAPLLWTTRLVQRGLKSVAAPGSDLIQTTAWKEGFGRDGKYGIKDMRFSLETRGRTELVTNASREIVRTGFTPPKQAVTPAVEEREIPSSLKTYLALGLPNSAQYRRSKIVHYEGQSEEAPSFDLTTPQAEAGFIAGTIEWNEGEKSLTMTDAKAIEATLRAQKVFVSENPPPDVMVYSSTPGGDKKLNENGLITAIVKREVVYRSDLQVSASGGFVFATAASATGTAADVLVKEAQAASVLAAAVRSTIELPGMERATALSIIGPQLTQQLLHFSSMTAEVRSAADYKALTPAFNRVNDFVLGINVRIARDAASGTSLLSLEQILSETDQYAAEVLAEAEAANPEAIDLVRYLDSVATTNRPLVPNGVFALLNETTITDDPSQAVSVPRIIYNYLMTNHPDVPATEWRQIIENAKLLVLIAQSNAAVADMARYQAAARDLVDHLNVVAATNALLVPNGVFALLNETTITDDPSQAVSVPRIIYNYLMTNHPDVPATEWRQIIEQAKELAAVAQPGIDATASAVGAIDIEGRSVKVTKAEIVANKIVFIADDPSNENRIYACALVFVPSSPGRILFLINPQDYIGYISRQGQLPVAPMEEKMLGFDDAGVKEIIGELLQLAQGLGVQRNTIVGMAAKIGLGNEINTLLTAKNANAPALFAGGTISISHQTVNPGTMAGVFRGAVPVDLISGFVVTNAGRSSRVTRVYELGEMIVRGAIDQATTRIRSLYSSAAQSQVLATTGLQTERSAMQAAAEALQRAGSFGNRVQIDLGAVKVKIAEDAQAGDVVIMHSLPLAQGLPSLVLIVKPAGVVLDSASEMKLISDSIVEAYVSAQANAAANQVQQDEVKDENAQQQLLKDKAANKTALIVADSVLQVTDIRSQLMDEGLLPDNILAATTQKEIDDFKGRNFDVVVNVATVNQFSGLPPAQLVITDIATVQKEIHTWL